MSIVHFLSWEEGARNVKRKAALSASSAFLKALLNSSWWRGQTVNRPLYSHYQVDICLTWTKAVCLSVCMCASGSGVVLPCASLSSLLPCSGGTAYLNRRGRKENMRWVAGEKKSEDGAKWRELHLLLFFTVFRRGNGQFYTSFSHTQTESSPPLYTAIYTSRSPKT